MAKKGTAPCGHPGTAVTANFFTCDLKCHKPATAPQAKEFDDFENETTDEFDIRQCPKCGSFQCDEFGAVRGADGKSWSHCWDCGAVFP